MRSRPMLAAAAVTALLTSAGCGSSGAKSAHEAVVRVACLSRAEAVAQSDLVRSAFANGEVGSATYLRRHVFGASVPTSAYLDAAGRLKPLFAMPREAQDEFLGWLSTLEKSQSWSDRLDAAGRRARKLASCPTE